MNVMIIPDLHGRKFWRKAIADNIGNVDKVVFLGDYLDPYGDEIEENPDSMDCISFYDAPGLLETLNDIIRLKKNEPNKYILLTGNHTNKNLEIFRKSIILY
jgi:predicted phosphodiesterase